VVQVNGGAPLVTRFDCIQTGMISPSANQVARVMNSTISSSGWNVLLSRPQIVPESQGSIDDQTTLGAWAYYNGPVTNSVRRHTHAESATINWLQPDI
jgi:hypothetical protein